MASGGALGLLGSIPFVHFEDLLAVFALDPCIVEELGEPFLIKSIFRHVLPFGRRL